MPNAMKTLQAILREMWTNNRMSTVFGLLYLAAAIYGLTNVVSLANVKEPPGVDPLFSQGFMLLMAIGGLGVGLFYVGRAFIAAHTDVLFDRASPEEQDKMIARETGMTIDQVRMYRRQARRNNGND